MQKPVFPKYEPKVHLKSSLLKSHEQTTLCGMLQSAAKSSMVWDLSESVNNTKGKICKKCATHAKTFELLAKALID